MIEFNILLDHDRVCYLRRMFSFKGYERPIVSIEFQQLKDIPRINIIFLKDIIEVMETDFQSPHRLSSFAAVETDFS
jgi:hypothetical protein